MDVEKAIGGRRSLRAIGDEPIDEKSVALLVRAARLAPSCFNNQPWRLVFVKSEGRLERLWRALSPKNDWVKSAPLIIAAFSNKEDDCSVSGTDYHLFDTGIALGQLMLQAWELGLVAHAIAGFNAKEVEAALNAPGGYHAITLVAIGKPRDSALDKLTDDQRLQESQRPKRFPVKLNFFNEEYGRGMEFPQKIRESL